MDGPVSAAARAVDVALREVLGSVRLAASLISRAELTAPYRIASRGMARAMFHAIVEGDASVRQGGTETTVRSGDVVLFPQGASHEIGSGRFAATAYIEDLVVVDDGSCVGVVSYGGGGTRTRIVCGSFELRHPAGRGMLGALPSRLVARGRPDAADVTGWLDQTIRLLAGALDRRAPEANAVVDRLTDILVMHVLRACAGTPDAVGWLAALRDGQIAKALATIHGDPGGRLRADDLAARVGMSRSAFFSRFNELVGEPPAQYLARWRLAVAADLMSDGSLSIAELAERVGYASEDAFCRAFKRHMGVSPRAYRHRVG